MKYCFLLIISFSFNYLQSQTYTTAGAYEVRTEKNIEYGKVQNYLGIEDTLLLDLYKPVGDNNLNRPLLIFIHGGSWLGGCKDEVGSLIPFAEEFASRGYVVALINYRLGWHKDDYVATPAGPPLVEAIYSAFYAADSSEMIRALFRAMQDTKGAIRFLKARNAIDSTCISNVYVGGESAGAFIAIATAFLDRNEEKPASCFEIANAPEPQDNLLNAVADCEFHEYELNDSSLQRKDLGSIDGFLNLNGYTSEVKGVLSFYGGVPTEAFTKHWFENNSDIPIYFYHQTCDGIVNFSYGKPMAIISANCNLGFDPWHYNYPNMFGNGALSDSLIADGEFSILTDFEYCDPFLIPLFDCIRYGDNGSYHFMNNIAQRAINSSEFLSPYILANENDSDCKDSIPLFIPTNDIVSHVFPNPFQNNITIKLNRPVQNIELQITDLTGKAIYFSKYTSSDYLYLNLDAPQGIYFLNIKSDDFSETYKLIKQ